MSRTKNYYLDKHGEEDIESVLEKELDEQERSYYER